MLDKFIDYTNQIFPSIDTNIKNGIKDLINQFDISKPNWFSKPLEILSQGDILDKIPFSYVDENGEETTFFTKGIILSNTCDLTRDKYIIIAPLIPFEHDFKEITKQNIKNNIVSGKMCFTNSYLDNYYIDFSMSSSFVRKIINNLYDDGKIKRLHSLSQFGFYFLCSKIAVYYLRVENYENFNNRDKEMFLII